MTRLARTIARFRQWLAGSAAATATEPEPKREMQISIQAAWEAQRTGRPVASPDQVFARPRPMKGVIPGGMAMDEVLPANIAGDWGTQSIYESMMHEGLRFEGYPYLAQLAQRAEYRMIAEKWAEHATRKWIKFTGDKGRVAKIIEELDRLQVRDKFKECAEQDGFFGRSQIFLDFDDADDVAELETALPVDPGKIGKKRPLKRLKVVEPMWSYPGPYNTRNPLAAGFYRPSTWYIYGKTVHDSHLLTFVGREVPDMLKPAYAFGGLSMTQMSKPYVDNWLRTRQSVSDMVHSFSTMVLGTDMDSVLSGGDGATLYARADMFNATRDNRGLMIVNKESETLENVSVPISGLDKLQAQAQEQLSAVSGIPLVILLGVTPSGLNASSDGEVRSFYAAVKAYQNKTFRPGLARLLDIVQLSLFGAIDQTIKFEFEDLWEMSEKDEAEIQKNKSEVDANYINAGVVDPEETRERLRSDETSIYHGVNLTGPAPELDDGDDDDAEVGEDAAIPFGDAARRDQPRDEHGRWTATGAIREHVTRALRSGKEHSTTSLGTVSAANADKVKAMTGVSIHGHERVIQSSDIRHVLNSHGDPEVEADRGQAPVRKADFAQIPNIVERAHAVTAIGKPKAAKPQRLEYVARIGEHEYRYVEELRPAQVVALKSMRKKL